jgi:hypothetical protein
MVHRKKVSDVSQKEQKALTFWMDVGRSYVFQRRNDIPYAITSGTDNVEFQISNP